MAGYAARKHPATGVAQELWAKALVLDDGHGGRAAIVTMDLLRVPRIVLPRLEDELERRYGLKREQVLLNCSHNHSGPALWEDDPFTALSPADNAKSREYTEGLLDKFVALIGEALRNLAPATVSEGTGEAGFAANRRLSTPKGYQIAYNPNGPVDRRMPVVKVAASNGALIAVLFGYACHNTTIGPASYEINGDYAGFAQAELERAHPGAVALFLQLCAGDQDPHPRGGKEMAERHGKELAAAVEKELGGHSQRTQGAVRTAWRTARLAFAPQTREAFERQLNDPLPARARNARAMLKAYDDGKPVTSLAYPVQAIRVGKTLTLVAIGGEPVVDYALRAKREFPGVILAGYSNEVRSYVPSRRVLAEGGYEAEESMLYYRLPGPYTSAVEDTIFESIKAVLAATSR